MIGQFSFNNINLRLNGITAVEFSINSYRHKHAFPCNYVQLLFFQWLILPSTLMFYYSHISLLTTVCVWQQGLQDVFKSLLLMSC